MVWEVVYEFGLALFVGVMLGMAIQDERARQQARRHPIPPRTGSHVYKPPLHVSVAFRGKPGDLDPNTPPSGGSAVSSVKEDAA